MYFRRAILGAFAALCLLAAPAAAQDEVALIQGASQLQPQLALYFPNGVYSPSCTPITNCLSAARTSAGMTDLTYLDVAGSTFNSYAANTLRIRPGRGLLVEDSRTNYLFPSASPANGTSGTLPDGNVFLWLICDAASPSCSITLSNNGAETGCSGTAIQGLPVSTVVTGGGACDYTVSGTVLYAQLESANASLGPSSYIPTTVAPVTRSTEVVSAIGALHVLMVGQTGYMTVGANGSAGYLLLDRNDPVNYYIAGYNGATTIRAQTNGISINAVSGWHNIAFTNDVGSQNLALTSWGVRGISVAWNKGNVIRNARNFPLQTISTASYVGNANGANSNGGFITSIGGANYLPWDGALQHGTYGWSLNFLRGVGDSTTFGTGSAYNYPSQAVALLPGGIANYPTINLGVSGTTALQAVGYWSTFDAIWHDSTVKKCTDLIWLGTNDISIGAESMATIEASLTTLWQNSHSQGCKVVAITILPRMTVAMPVSYPTFEANRQTLNAWILGQSALWDAVVDVGSDPTIGIANQYTASTIGTNMTVSAMTSGAVQVGGGAKVYGVGATPLTVGTTVVSQTSGTPGGVGVYVISVSQTVASEAMMSVPSLACYNADATHPNGSGACGTSITGGDGIIAKLVVQAATAAGIFPYLLRRDLDPASNDNRPMYVEIAA